MHHLYSQGILANGKQQTSKADTMKGADAAPFPVVREPAGVSRRGTA